MQAGVSFPFRSASGLDRRAMCDPRAKTSWGTCTRYTIAVTETMPQLGIPISSAPMMARKT
ncbi:hypothetical protein CH063_10559 [Colletotrichum higginsianum]|uniref:Uncharacterized protein n=1 Tax=Colletotrichum higginsianum (strain IMI 349063) TaxID=759273 RepID=H1VHX9_COLHI|nr:hypothetical protein CH63R_13802 [Colletotrichum higginsianum IMI 349063]OBR02576.1 hypothetical protein CH63R_13802 [Colletotrichum higginsianum IMI 349063]CCF39832.1 hypothetical protein CH063_10559 [Colletotrichum higginsianum]